MALTLNRSETRLCINCRHYLFRTDHTGHKHFCLRGVSLVTGEAELTACETMRGVWSGSCGVSGDHFEPHPDKTFGHLKDG